MRRLSELEKVEIWDRFEAGKSQRSVSRRLGRSPSTMRTLPLGRGFVDRCPVLGGHPGRPRQGFTPCESCLSQKSRGIELVTSSVDRKASFFVQEGTPRSSGGPFLSSTRLG